MTGYHPVYGNSIQIVDEIAKAYPDIRLAEKWRGRGRFESGSARPSAS